MAVLRSPKTCVSLVTLSQILLLQKFGRSMSEGMSSESDLILLLEVLELMSLGVRANEVGQWVTVLMMSRLGDISLMLVVSTCLVSLVLMSWVPDLSLMVIGSM
jgi:hypothetical protein